MSSSSSSSKDFSSSGCGQMQLAQQMAATRFQLPAGQLQAAAAAAAGSSSCRQQQQQQQQIVTGGRGVKMLCLEQQQWRLWQQTEQLMLAMWVQLLTGQQQQLQQQGFVGMES
jgi:hypothetical protein